MSPLIMLSSLLLPHSDHPPPMDSSIHPSPLSIPTSILPPHTPISFTICSPKWVTVHGVTYKKPGVMVVSPATTYEDPTFGQIEKVFVVNCSDVYFYVQIMDTHEYNPHFSAYIARDTPSWLIAYHQFVSYLPLHMHTISSISPAICIVPIFIPK